MARTPNKDLEGFYRYLQDTLGPTSPSISTYCSMVRRVLKAVPVLTEENLTDFFYEELNSTARSNIRAAWNQYVRFMGQFCGEHVPQPGYRRSPKKEWQKVFVDGGEIPAPVLEAVWKLVNIRRWPLSVLVRGTWGAVVERPESVRLGNRALIHAHGKVNYWNCSEEELAPLRAWAVPDGKSVAGIPLLPRAPGSPQPYPLTTLTLKLAQVVVTQEMVQDHPLQQPPAAVPSRPLVDMKGPTKPKVSDEVGRPCSVEELTAIMTLNSPPPTRENQNFFFVLDARVPAESKRPEGMRSREEIEEARAKGPARTSAIGGSFHAELDAELALLEAWERGEEVKSVDRPPVKVEPFMFDLDEE